ncbi:MAG: MotA/TolQ/ExbB proton channel family protein [Deltaproteobacteria bacterium]|nr:MotA/TolQ/ExbB proton channel family protein [Deltaproteobacteria bacterium]
MTALLGLVLGLSLALSVRAEDMRAAARKAKAEYEAAGAAHRDNQQRIREDKKALEGEVGTLEREVSALAVELETINEETRNLAVLKVELEAQRSDSELGLRELTGSLRVAARDLDAALTQSPLTALHPERRGSLTPLMDKDRFPDLADAARMTELLFEEMEYSGEVSLQEIPFIGRDGQTVSGDVLVVGPFTAAYRTDTETGFLRYSEDTAQFFALAALPDWLVRRSLNRYFDGRAEALPMDITGGAALRQIVHTNSLADQIRNGGLLIWPILAIAAMALLMTVERTIFLKRVHDNADRVMGKVNALARQGRWAECDDMVREKKDRPVYNVLKAGLAARGESRETLESILQEAILKELPRLERLLPMLNMLGAVAPLLGLLGTVTGMIATFHVITLHGTGDPRMMSGGISEALVTTMFGLAVAIPIMLAHTFLSRNVNHIVGDMEEKAVALTNIIYRESTCTCRP